MYHTKLDRQIQTKQPEKKKGTKESETRNEDGIFCVLSKDPDLISK